MKKALIFLILIAMLCITACNSAGGDVSGDVSDDASIEASADSSASSSEDTATTSVVNSEDSSQASSEESSKDPYEGWTKVFGNVYIPDLPFSDWKGQNQDNINCYKIFIESRDSATFHAYVQSLPDFGYTIEQLNSYEYKGTDPQNRTMYFTDPQNGWLYITIYY